MPMESLVHGESLEEYLRALVALSLATATAATRLRSRAHIDRDTLRRAMRKLIVGMRVYR